MEEDNQTTIPLLFRCPISLDLFIDPVTLPTGQTYDRPSIHQWLAAGNSTCPVTMQRLPSDFSFVPNNTLQQCIHRWLLHGLSHPSNPLHNSGLSFSLTIIKTTLLSPQTTLISKLAALRKVRLLSAESDVGKFLITQLDFFPVLVHLVFKIPFKLVDFELVELALDSILRLFSPKNSPHLIAVLTQDPAFSSLIALMHTGSPKIKSLSCILIQTITNSSKTNEIRDLFTRSRPLLRSLISLLSEKQSASEAATAIAGICRSRDHLRDMIEEGAVEGLLRYLTSFAGANGGAALAAMEALMGEEKGRREGERVGVVGVMVEWVFRVSGEEEGSERAVGALAAICGGSVRARREAVGAGVVTQLLLLIQSGCGGRAKAGARELLKFLRCCWEDDDYE